MRKREMMVGYIFIAPWLIGVTLFFFFNLARSIQFSFNNVNLAVAQGYELNSVGFANYRFAFLEHGTFVRVLAESIGETLISVPIIIFFSLFAALLINRKFALRGVVRAIFFLPVIMASPAINSAMSTAMQAMMGGVTAMSPDMPETATGVNTMALLAILTDYGLPVQIAEYIASAIIMLFDMIRASGVQIIIFLAALQSVPTSMYEVAKIEGATAYETFWKITFPMISPLLLTNVVYTIVDGFSESEVVTLAHETAFGRLNFGLSAVMSISSSIMIAFVLIITGFIISKKVFYQT